MAWRARDRATDAIVLAAIDCTEEQFVVALVEHYGEDWVYGTVEQPPRFAIEEYREDTVRDIEWPNSDGTVTRGIAFPCRRKDCKNEVKVDEAHPQFAELKAAPIALCNACLHKHVS
jgi:hypothetical protein